MRVPEVPRSAAAILPGVGYIPLRDRHGKARAWAVVDLADFPRLGGLRWHVGTGGYAVRMEPKPEGGQWKLGLHRAVLGLGYGDPIEVDHRDLDKLNNRRSNLRTVTRGENAQNWPAYGIAGTSSRYRGVSWDRRCRKWTAQVVLERKHHWLGYHATEEAAAAVVRAWRAEHMPFATD